MASREYGVRQFTDDSPITGFFLPLVCKKELDSVVSFEEKITVTPDAVLGVCFDDFIRVTSVPEGLGSLNLA